MKKTILFFAIGMLAFTIIKAQTADEKNTFPGNWDLVMVGLPQGDTKCQLVLNERDGQLSGILKFGDPQPSEAAIINPVIKDTVLTFNATLQGYDIDYNLALNKEGLLNGSMFGNMFVVTGKRSEAVEPAK